MTRETETIDLREEADRLDSELDDLADKVARIDADAVADGGDDESEPDYETQAELEEAFEQVERKEQQLKGVLWAIEEYGDPAKCGAEKENGGTCQNPAESCPHHDTDPEPNPVEVTIGGLTTGEYAEVQDYTDTVRNQKIGFGENASVEGQGSIYFAAGGLVDAPFIKPESDLLQKSKALQNTVPQFKTWIETRVDEKTTPDVEMGNFGERLEAAQERMEGT